MYVSLNITFRFLFNETFLFGFEYNFEMLNESTICYNNKMKKVTNHILC